ncbi:TatD family hydrolase [Naumannella halotolerans]|uniref:TatD family hydrolase n=1 Tax=Naumannella halotolerans TaxID=993414 RepID=UPI00370DA6C4
MADRTTLPEAPEPLPAPVADSHTHLDSTRDHRGLQPAEAIARAAEVNVTRLVQVGCDLAGSAWALEIADSCPEVVAAVALHPNDAARLGDRLPDELTALRELAETAGPRLRAIGETGLDHFRTREPELQKLQQVSFAEHIALANELGLTLVIHDRDAHTEILQVLDAEGIPERVVMHCFSGDAEFARACLDRGAWLSFPGPVTFKPNDALREAARITPADRLLTETDAPYLTPMPLRGRPNASYLMPYTVRFLAELRGEDLTELCHRLTQNTFAAFGGPW